VGSNVDLYSSAPRTPSSCHTRFGRGDGRTLQHGQTPMTTKPVLLDVVALLDDRPEHGLVRGQVGTIVEELDGTTVLVEFSDDEGQTWALAPIPRSCLLVLRYKPLAA
jgi:hypothetical protein